MKRYIMVFKNTNDAVRGEEILKNKSINMTMMPTPTQITQSCGICALFNEEELEKINNIIEDKKISFKNIYEISSNGFSIYK
ncbi:Protein of unknown function [Clostridium cavendishii DSM 21758]|uniref:Putative Se/S carrier protein-like domain-containing protein n=1 Tax=Clostridium cavendishii DSM 21758 TaxID=1121302 RepID=A0A1M6TJR6_9CLOT|nr:DUF3343 domain-containing protein [Clostridium cavendishii]SHK57153.1 Protein of unknown function [Clostridium cavendishii DSM 21758]